MINHIEIRIGNKIEYDGIRTVQSIVLGGNKKYKVWVKGRITPIYLNDCNPIPLTAEILEKVWFRQLPHFTVINSCNLDIGRGRMLSVGGVGTPNEMVCILEAEPPVVKAVIVIRNYDFNGKTYLHHLQNICSDFGKELEINLA